MHSELVRLHDHAARVAQATRNGQIEPAEALRRLRQAVVTDARGVSWVILPVAGVLVLHNTVLGREPLEAHHSTFSAAPRPALAAWQAPREAVRRPRRLYVAAALLLALFSLAVLRLGPAEVSGSAVVAEMAAVVPSVACVGVCSNGDRALTLPASPEAREQSPQERCADAIVGTGTLVSAVAIDAGVLCRVKVCEKSVSSVTEGGGVLCAQSRSQS
jgi:hypothetical protein